MSTGHGVSKTNGNKLPKGEFPTNIRIVKDSSNEDGHRAMGGAKSGSRKPGKLFHDMNLETLPKFKDVSPNHRIELFKAKLRAC